MKDVEPKARVAPNQWWEKFVDQLSLKPEYREFLLGINLTMILDGKERRLIANTPDGQREVHFTTISGTPALAYIGEETSGCPKIKFVLIPGLPLEEITRQGLLDKRLWGGVEEL